MTVVLDFGKNWLMQVPHVLWHQQVDLLWLLGKTFCYNKSLANHNSANYFKVQCDNSTPDDTKTLFR